MTQHSDERGAELRELFFESAQELLQALNEEALKLEKRPGDTETVRSIRRAVHTLKGDAAACGYRELSELAHELEDVLGLETASAHGSLADVAFAAADTFSAMLTAYRKKHKLPSVEPLHKMIRELAASPVAGKGRKKKAQTPVSAAVWSEYEKLAVQNAFSRGKRVFHIAAQVDSHCAMPIAARQLVLNGLTSAGEILASRPESGSAESTQRLEFLLASEKSVETIAAKCKIPTVIAHVKVEALKGKVARKKAASQEVLSEVAVEELTQQAPVSTTAVAVEEPEQDVRPQASLTSAENILRVDAERIDNVLNLVGELIIGKSMLQQALNEFARIYPKEAIRGKFADAMSFQARVLNDLQRSVMKIRMVPVEQLVPPLSAHGARRRQAVQSPGKPGDQRRRYRSRQEHPRRHRRAADSPRSQCCRPRHRKRRRSAESRQAGTGTVRLDAYHHGNQVIVEVTR